MFSRFFQMGTGLFWMLLIAGSTIAADTALPVPEKAPYLQKTSTGAIQWSEAIIQAEGTHRPADKKDAKPKQRPKSIAMARLDGQQKLLETAKQMRIDSMTTLGDVMSQSEFVRKGLEGIIRNLPISRQRFLTDGTVMAQIDLPIHGAFSQLVLPEELKQVQAIQPIGEKPAKAPAQTSNDNGPAPPVYTGLVVDARGLRFQPALMPSLLDENGQVLYGAAFASREHAVQQGMVLYLVDTAEASRSARVGNHPFMVKALRVNGAKQSEVVISNSDAATLRSASAHLSFLKKCQVIIVAIPPKKRLKPSKS